MEEDRKEVFSGKKMEEEEGFVKEEEEGKELQLEEERE